MKSRCVFKHTFCEYTKRRRRWLSKGEEKNKSLMRFRLAKRIQDGGKIRNRFRRRAENNNHEKINIVRSKKDP